MPGKPPIHNGSPLKELIIVIAAVVAAFSTLYGLWWWVA